MNHKNSEWVNYVTDSKTEFSRSVKQIEIIDHLNWTTPSVKKTNIHTHTHSIQDKWTYRIRRFVHSVLHLFCTQIENLNHN